MESQPKQSQLETPRMQNKMVPDYGRKYLFKKFGTKLDYISFTGLVPVLDLSIGRMKMIKLVQIRPRNALTPLSTLALGS